MAVFKPVMVVLAALLVAAHAIPTISVTGSKFFTSEGKQFYLKGIAYQLIEDDPLIDIEQCQRDAALMQKLGANSIRVYHVNATADHSACMNAFASVGIYLWVDLDTFGTYIRLGEGPSWTKEKSDAYRAVMDNFQQYDNTAGFFVGNEVLNSQGDSSSAPYLLSATADLRAYGKIKGYRSIPIGYSATDTGALPMLADYLVCRPNPEERLDFYGLNSYRWCGESTFEQSGYNTILNSTANFPVPIFFSEVGCNTAPPRTFGDQAAVFGPMADAWSGSIVYEWIQELNNYGLVRYGETMDASVNDGRHIVQGFVRDGEPTPIGPDFDNLQKQWATLHPTGVDSKAYAATVKTTAPACPTPSGGWVPDPNAPLPTLGQAVLSDVTPGMPTSISSGSITAQSSPVAGTGSSQRVTGTNETPAGSAVTPASTSGNAESGQSGQSGQPSGSAATTSQAAAGRTVYPPVLIDFGVFLKASIVLASTALWFAIML